MNLGFSSKAKAFFVDVDSPAYLIEASVNVILSPSMYWVKRVTLPVKYLHEVRPLLPSLLAPPALLLMALLFLAILLPQPVLWFLLMAVL